MAEKEFQRCTPESQGISSTAILAFVDAVNQKVHELHGFMLLRHGVVVSEGWWDPYRADRPHMLFSLSKSFTSSGIGLAVSEGRLSIDDKVISFFPDDLPAEIDPNLAKMRVRDLLSMSTGHEKDSTERMVQSGNWVKGFLSLAVEFEPGTHFVYNSGATYMLSAIVQKVTGMKLIDYLQPRLFAPLGIQGATWETSPQGINTGGWGLSIKTEDIARFGQMYLQKGVWNGKRVLPEAWVTEATSYKVSNKEGQSSPDWQQGYCYQFWRCRHNAYRGDGAFGQYCIVMPDQDAVVAINSGVADMQQVLDLVWDLLLPEMKEGPLPENEAGDAQLKQMLAGLKLTPPSGTATSPLASKVSGKLYRLDENTLKIEKIGLEFKPDGCIMTVERGKGEEKIACGSGAWKEGLTTLFNDQDEIIKVAASGVWEAEDAFMITLRLYETPFFITLTYSFKDDQVTVKMVQNVGFDPKDAPLLTGKMM